MTNNTNKLEMPQNATFLTMKERKFYNSWRLRILLSIIVGYGAYYLCRQNFAMVMPAFMEEFNYTKTQIGLVLSCASIVYGIGKFVNGYVSDKSNARYFMPLGLFASAIVSFFLGFVDGIYMLGALWIINNWFQSMGWPPAARILTHWFAPSELGTKWALGAASHQIGGAITLILSGYIVAKYGWRWGFIVPSIISMCIAIILFDRLRESPKVLGLPAVELYKSQDNSYDGLEEDTLPTTEIFRKVFLNKNMWLICLANICVYIVRVGIIFWGPLFLSEFKGVAIQKAGWQIAAYEAAGLLGGVAAGYISDVFYKGQRGIVGSTFMIALIGLLFAFWQIPAGHNTISTFILVLAGFFVYGPQVLIGVASADFASKKAIGTANGLAGTMGYVGAAISGIGVGLLIDSYGWPSAFIFFMVSSFIGSVLFFLTYQRSKI